ncbi:MAG: hypothetical protein EBR02_02425 [Alphaproteobacteria bacterium]|nr:hypothetical protein [Alphaproteobacteria bacterium]
MPDLLAIATPPSALDRTEDFLIENGIKTEHVEQLRETERLGELVGFLLEYEKATSDHDQEAAAKTLVANAKTILASQRTPFNEEKHGVTSLDEAMPTFPLPTPRIDVKPLNKNYPNAVEILRDLRASDENIILLGEQFKLAEFEAGIAALGKQGIDKNAIIEEAKRQKLAQSVSPAEALEAALTAEFTRLKTPAMAQKRPPAPAVAPDEPAAATAPAAKPTPPPAAPKPAKPAPAPKQDLVLEKLQKAGVPEALHQACRQLLGVIDKERSIKNKLEAQSALLTFAANHSDAFALARGFKLPSAFFYGASGEHDQQRRRFIARSGNETAVALIQSRGLSFAMLSEGTLPLEKKWEALAKLAAEPELLEKVDGLLGTVTFADMLHMKVLFIIDRLTPEAIEVIAKNNLPKDLILDAKWDKQRETLEAFVRDDKARAMYEKAKKATAGTKAHAISEAVCYLPEHEERRKALSKIAYSGIDFPDAMLPEYLKLVSNDQDALITSIRTHQKMFAACRGTTLENYRKFVDNKNTEAAEEILTRCTFETAVPFLDMVKIVALCQDADALTGQKTHIHVSGENGSKKLKITAGRETVYDGAFDVNAALEKLLPEGFKRPTPTGKPLNTYQIEEPTGGRKSKRIDVAIFAVDVPVGDKTHAIGLKVTDPTGQKTEEFCSVNAFAQLARSLEPAASKKR